MGRSARVLVGNAEPVLLASSSSVPGQPHTGFLLRNLDAANEVDLGDSNVTSGAGFPLQAGEQLPVDLEYGETLYAIAGAGQTVNVAVLEVGA